MRETPDPETLLAWYDTHARDLVWRTSPADILAGVRPNPYHVWLSEVMLQQTSVATMGKYFVKFTTLWPTVERLAHAQDAQVMAAWAGLGYYARARNLLKCARTVTTDYQGVFPNTPAELHKLPGIGPYTSAAIAAIAFDVQATVVDGNVERVMSRIYAINRPLPTSKPELTRLATALTPAKRPGDYAQAVMDLGATICTPKNPACGICPWRGACKARKQGIAAHLPKRVPKTIKPTRSGIAYVVRNANGAWLLETRPQHGLLGGMLGWPGSEWGEQPQPNPPLHADWHDSGFEVRHTFTHFHLKLRVLVAHVGDATPRSGKFVPHHEFRPSDLPTIMRKVFDAAKHIATPN